MTKKLIFLLAFVLQVSLVASAAHVTQAQAKSEALAFIQQKQGAPKSLRFMASAPRVQSASIDNACYYIFNVGNNGGFVIVSGDDRTNPILGFSDEGAFDPNNVPANMQSWLKGYEEQIKALDTMSDSEAKRLLAAPKLRATVDTRNSIAPMISTKWDQAIPYWNECPQFMNSDDENDGYELAYTGCVATAMSQLMKFHEYPAQTTQAGHNLVVDHKGFVGAERLHDEVEDVEQFACIPAREAQQCLGLLHAYFAPLKHLVGLQGMVEQAKQVVLVERVEHIDLRAREERPDDLERGILGGGTDEGDDTLFHSTQQ